MPQHPLVIARHLCGLSQVDLAHAAGVSVSTIQSVEQRRHTPRLDNAARIALVLDTTIDALFSEAPMDVERLAVLARLDAGGGSGRTEAVGAP